MSRGSLSVEDVIRSALGPGAMVEGAEPLGGGVSAEVSRVRVALRGERREVVVRRRGPGSYWGADPARVGAEWAVYQAAARAGIPVAEPIMCVDDADGPAAFVTGFVQGAAPITPGVLAGVVDELAAILARIHAIPLAGLDVVQRSPAGEQLEPPAWWRETPPTAEADRVRAILAAHPPVPIHDRRLLHGDFWPGNLLVRDGRLVAVLDWEDCLIGDPLQDVAISRLDLTWTAGTEIREQFTAAYARASGRDLSALAAWDLFAALRAAPGLDLWAPAYPKLGRPDLTVELLQSGLTGFIEDAIARL
ncbi:MAG: phosphotransferase family protein [Dehalococcoidia bacterium]